MRSIFGTADAWVTALVLVSLVIYVTLDLNQPRRGLIVVSQEPVERLIESMKP